MFKSILLDLDDTIFNYSQCNKIALSKVLHYLDVSNDLYEAHNKQVKSIPSINLHNKLLTFQRLVEYKKLHLNTLLEVERIYWKEFEEHITMKPGCDKFLEYCRNNNISVCVITDFTCYHQLLKLEKLHIIDKIKLIVSSEEVNSEKPSRIIFERALEKLCVNASEVCMIGDNFDRDIIGATRMGIYSFWLSENKFNSDRVSSFSSFEDLLVLFQDINYGIRQHFLLSNMFSDFNYTQGAGGNISVKVGKFMIIKSSGFRLKDVNLSNGFSILDNTGNIIRGHKPSMEYPMHIKLEYKYVIHLHPVSLTKTLVDKNGEKIIKEIFPESLFINYTMPGINLANEITEQNPLIFLQNHGIIVSGNTVSEVISIIENIVDVNLKYNNNIEAIHIPEYNLYKLECPEMEIKSFFGDNLYTPLTPDNVVYLGCSVKTCFSEAPSICLENGKIWVVNTSPLKCEDSKEVLFAYCLIHNENSQPLICEDIELLIENEDEKYRIKCSPN